MKCEKTELLKHLSVHQPAALAEEPWRSHVGGCTACREEWNAFAWSLAVYRRIEQEQASHLNPHPRWKAFVRHLAEQESAQRRARAVAGPWLAGMMGLILVGGLVSWGVWSESGEPLLPNFSARDASPLSVSNPAPATVRRRVPAHVLTVVSTPEPRSSLSAGGGYRRTLPEWRALPRSTSFLDGRTIALDDRYGDMVIMPFAHQRTDYAHLVPIANSDPRIGVPYGVAGPVR